MSAFAPACFRHSPRGQSGLAGNFRQSSGGHRPAPLVLLVALWMVLGSGCTRWVGGRSFRRSLPAIAPITRSSVLHQPQPTRRRPKGKFAESNWAWESENFSARAPDVSSNWPFAVIAHRVRLDADLALLRTHLRLALDLAPRFLVLVSDIAVTTDGRFCHAGRIADFGPDSIPVPVFLCPGPYGRSHFTIPCAPFGAIVYTTLADDTASSPPGNQQFPGRATDCGDQQTTFVIVDRRRAVPLQSGAWHDALSQYGLAQGRSVVLVLGGDRFSWQQDTGVDVLTVPWLRRDDDVDEAVLDGRFSGIVWGALSNAGASVRVVRDSGAISLACVAREFQDERSGLRDTFTASQVWDANPVTTVACRNVTNSPLHFDAHWQFGCYGVSVDPQILGFDLAPGEGFKQEFRFAFPDSVLLKQAAPVLVCRTEMAGPGDRRAPLTVRVAPRCTVSGTMVTLPGSFASDGDLREWSSPAYALGRVDQVGRDDGGGPTRDDAAGGVFVGVRGDVICVALFITDDHWLTSPAPGDEVTIACAALETGPKAAAGGTDLFKVVFGGDGQYRSTWGHGVAQATVGVRLAQGRMGVEVCLPEELTRRAREAGALQLEVTFRDRDPGDSGETVLVLSGGLEQSGDRRHFARFFFPGADPE